MSIQIESDLKEILQRFEQRFDKIDQKLDKLSEDVTELKAGQARIEGEIKAVDERLSGQIESVDERLSGKIDALEATVSGLDKRVSTQEFTNRGVLIGLIVVILGGAAKFFGIVGNP